jgi:SAM-dependent methyltransferase
MFDGKYFEWNQKRIKSIVDFYGYKFFYFKRILDLGCGYGDLGGVVYRLGADVTGVDARQEHLKIVNKKYTGIKTVQANLDAAWPFHGQKFDLILDLGLLCHLGDYEAHLKAVCASTTHLVLETAVCDSDDPQKVIVVDEDKGTYDLSYSGKGCRPSAAAIERVLRDCGMNFKRMDNSKFNASDYSYDWYPKNDNSTSLSKRRIWFAVRESSPIQFANPGSEMALPPVNITPSPQGYITPIQNMPTTASPRPPMSARMDAEARARVQAANASYGSPGNTSYPGPSPIHTYQRATNLNEKIRIDSKEFALIEVDSFIASLAPPISGVISPNSYSSRMWYKKIAPAFPGLKLSKNVLSMPGFAKVDKVPDVVMCSIDNLQVYNRIWIDEWFGLGLTDAHVDVLKRCHTIITPSLINAQEIWKHIPHANIFRVTKPWPDLEVEPATGDYFLYFEKSPQLTELLFNSWDNKFGRLVVVGSSIKVPSFVTFISDTESYVQIMKLIRGAKAIIDLSDNNYYASGINRLITGLGASLITNNHIRFGENIQIVQQNRQVSIYPTIDDIKGSINKFMTRASSKASNSGAYNQSVAEDVRKIIGV